MAKKQRNKKVRWWNIALPIVTPAVALSVAIPVTWKVTRDHSGGDTPEPTETFTITFEDDFDPSSTTSETQQVEKNALAKMILPEHHSNVGFIGWKEVKDGTPGSDVYPYFDFMNTPITQDYKLYGYWRRDTDPVKNKEAFNCTVNDKGDGVIINSLNKDYFLDTAHQGENKIVDVVVPDKITMEDGKSLPVVGIGTYNNGIEDCGAFQDYGNWARIGYNFHSISLPDTIQYFDTTAFRENELLRILNMPKNLQRVGSNCFQSCVKLADIKFYDKLEVIDAGAFSGNYVGSTESYIRSLELPSSLKFIGRGAFGLNAIQTLDLSKCNNLILGQGAFENAINLKEITLPEGLPYIPADCFNLCTRFRKITIPKSVKYIEQGAFSGCYRLREVHIASESELIFIEGWAFSQCYSLEKINFGEKIKSFGGSAFFECANLINVTFEKDRDWYVNGEGEAWNTKGLKPLEIAQKIFECLGSEEENTFEVKSFVDTKGIKYLTDDDANCFVVGTTNDFVGGNITIPNKIEIGEGEDAKQYNVAGIGSKAFKDKTDITGISFQEESQELGSPIQYIYNSAFEGCPNIQSIDFSNCKKLEYIGDYAFYNAFGASVTNDGTTIDFTACEKLTSIGNYAFSYSHNDYTGEIISVTLPSSLTYLGNGAFYNHKKISSFKFCPDSADKSNLTQIGVDEDSVLCVPIINSDAAIELIDMSKCSALKYLPLSAYQGCTGLSKITLPASLEYIYDYAFDGCTALTNITIPTSCHYIGYDVFDGCTGLTSVKFETPTNWIVTKGIISETVNVGQGEGGKSPEASNAERLKTIYNTYFWVKETA